ncbi:hypothetical protein GBAR_LOCUS2615 [Geodia barretti]|uniref:Uncharacterized protein n=1 Tax=Geodia barretti TaxID=519541 RepID=A0AA35R079_GEOBA|nr:hypothetical protein GBAR_LOCUS2615 [Geodia barretti]
MKGLCEHPDQRASERTFELLQTVRTDAHGCWSLLEEGRGADVSATAWPVLLTANSSSSCSQSTHRQGRRLDGEITDSDEPIALAAFGLIHVGVSLPCPPTVRQSLLETPTAVGQLEKLQTLMRQANRIVAEQVEQTRRSRGRAC